MLPKLAVEVRIGATNHRAFRLETDRIRFVKIESMSQSAPLRVKAIGHGIPDKWQVAIIDAQGMSNLNAANSNSIQDSEFYQVEKIDADHIDFLSLSGSGFEPYTGGGFLAFYLPKNLSSFTAARMDVKDSVGGTLRLTANTANGKLVIDPVNYSLMLTLTEADLATINAGEFVFDVELLGPGVIEAICSADSSFVVNGEVTTST